MRRSIKKVIYTCIVNGYDELKQPVVVDNSFDYICFTNDTDQLCIGVWEIKKIPYSDDNNTRLSRYVKMLPHKVLQDYDYSVWMDANLQITGAEFYNIINSFIEEKTLIGQVPHLKYNCIYKDIRKAYHRRRVGLIEALKQYYHLKRENFPEHFGLFENNLLLREHNNSFVVKIAEEWWNEYNNYTQRDQFCLMYIYWKNDYMPTLLFGPDKNVRNVDYIKYTYHPQKKNFLLRNNTISMLYDYFQAGKRRFFMLFFFKN